MAVRRPRPRAASTDQRPPSGQPEVPLRARCAVSSGSAALRHNSAHGNRNCRITGPLNQPMNGLLHWLGISPK